MRIAMTTAVLLLLAGCSDDSNTPSDGMDDGTDDGMDDGTDDGMDDGMMEPATHDVSISGSAFSPMNLQVHVGDTVRWTNQDGFAHTVDSTDGGPLDSGSMAQGAVYSFTFDEAGTFAYRCEFHASMTGSVTVS